MQEIIYIGIIIIIIYLIYKYKTKQQIEKPDIIYDKQIETFENIKKKSHKKCNQTKIFDKLNINQQENANKIKPYISEMKFHNHYRDVVTAVNDMMPVKQHYFNANNLPTQYLQADYNQIMNIANDFVKLLKDYITSLPEERHVNSGWDDAIPEATLDINNTYIKLYELPAKNGNIYLVNVYNYEQYETEDEIKYNMNIIIGKRDVDDQMIINVSMINNKSCLNKLLLENINIVGFLSDYGIDYVPINTRAPFTAFNQTAKSDIISTHEILTALEDNFIKKMNNVKIIQNNIDKDTQIFSDDLPLKTTLDAHKINRNICHDLNNL